jgi:nucleotide-binding universal stress UspA family protein
MNIVRILVPVDFSYHATGAMHLAMYLANRWRAAITVLHVDPLPGVGTVAIEPIYIAPQVFEGLHAEHDARVETHLEELRNEFLPLAAEGVTIETERRRGEATSGILEFAEQWQTDLIVMGSQGVSGLSQMVLGSTADRVSRVAPCPVLIAGRADDAGDEPRRFTRVLVAVDYSEFTAPVAGAAAAVVEPTGVLELVHIWNPPYLSALNASLGGDRPDLLAMIEEARRAQAEDIVSLSADLALDHANIDHFVGSGEPALALLERAEETSADLIVLGAHSRSNLSEHMLGTVADRVLRYAQIPVLLCPRTALPGDE